MSYFQGVLIMNNLHFIPIRNKIVIDIDHSLNVEQVYRWDEHSVISVRRTFCHFGETNILSFRRDEHSVISVRQTFCHFGETNILSFRETNILSFRRDEHSVISARRTFCHFKAVCVSTLVMCLLWLCKRFRRIYIYTRI